MILGISWNDFWEMNPAIIDAFREGHKLMIKENNALFHLNGIYTRDALMSTVGNMFKKKGDKAYEYPDEPYELGGNSNDGESDNKILTEAEKKEQTEAFFTRLRLMQANFNLAHGIDNGDSE